MPRVHGWVRMIVAGACGAVSLWASLDTFTHPAEDQSLGWAFSLIVVVCALTPFWLRPSGRRDAARLVPVGAGVAGRGIRFPNRRAAGPAMTVSLLAAGSASMFLTRSPDPETSGDPILFGCGVLILLVSPIGLVLNRMLGEATLTPEAVIVRRRGRTKVIPWRLIHAVETWERGSYQSEIRLLLISYETTLLTSIRVRRGPDSIAVQQQRNDPALLLHALCHYLHEPDDRHELASKMGLRRIASGDFNARAH